MDGFEPDANGDRARRDQPAGDPRPGAAAPGPLRPPRRRAAARQGRPRARSSRSTRARCRWPTTSTSTQIARDHARHGRRRPRATSPTRRRCWPPAAATSKVEQRGLHRRAREDHPRRAARQVLLTEDDRRRTAYHEAGHAIVGMLTPGADPVRKVSIIPRGHGARRDALDARRRPLQLRGATTCWREDQGRARRPRRRGDRVRRRSPPARSPTSSS